MTDLYLGDDSALCESILWFRSPEGSYFSIMLTFLLGIAD